MSFLSGDAMETQAPWDSPGEAPCTDRRNSEPELSRQVQGSIGFLTAPAMPEVPPEFLREVAKVKVHRAMRASCATILSMYVGK
jgi:hypothetical protein